VAGADVLRAAGEKRGLGGGWEGGGGAERAAGCADVGADGPAESRCQDGLDAMQSLLNRLGIRVF
jgi:hypothetical protein